MVAITHAAVPQRTIPGLISAVVVESKINVTSMRVAVIGPIIRGPTSAVVVGSITEVLVTTHVAELGPIARGPISAVVVRSHTKVVTMRVVVLEPTAIVLTSAVVDGSYTKVL